MLHIVDSSGAALVSYTYDPYGKPTVSPTTTNATLAEINPLRYRGYVYDSETGFYYLQSRYYDPAIGRFINADSYVSTGQGFLGCNMFAYCNNNSVRAVDPSGTASQIELSLLDYYIIHKIVQMIIVSEYGYAMEVYVIDSEGKRGFLDLYDYTTNQYYEVKHAKYSVLATEAQMRRYDSSTIKSWIFKEYTLAGFPARGTNYAISGSFTYRDFIVDYYVAESGLIHYEISPAGKKSPDPAYSTILSVNEKKNTNPWGVAGCLIPLAGASMIRRCMCGENSLINLGVS